MFNKIEIGPQVQTLKVLALTFKRIYSFTTPPPFPGGPPIKKKKKQKCTME